MIRPWFVWSLSAVLVSVAAARGFAGDFPAFEARTIDPHCGNICYAVTLADVNGDDRQDIVAVTENRVLWYENPSWERHVIIENQTVADNVCIAPHDIDGDGKIDFALGAGWPNKGGQILWLSRGKSLDDRWTVHQIGAEPSLHRMRFGDVLGTGTPQLTISPLMKSTGNGVRLTAFEIPRHPKTDRWPATVMNDALDRMHNHWHVDLDRDGRTDTLTASQEGVTLIRRVNDKWEATRLSPHAAGEVKTGRLKDGRFFIATVEPMHGNAVAVYIEPTGGKGEWRRHVIEETLKRGHAVWPADVDRDGTDEIVIGHSDPGTGEVKGPGVYVYDAQDDDGTRWAKHVIDNGGIATEDATAADLTGDGWPDIVAGGRATHNIKLYVNRGTP